MFVDVVFVVKEFVADELLGVSRARAQFGHAMDHVVDEMEVQIIGRDIRRALRTLNIYYAPRRVGVLECGGLPPLFERKVCLALNARGTDRSMPCAGFRST